MLSPILAQVTLEKVVENIDTGLLFPAENLIYIAAGLITVLLAVWGMRRYRAEQLEAAPLMTFRRIAVKLDLSLSQQWLLVRIARQQALPSPLTMLLSPATFAHHAALYLEHARPSRRHRERITLNAIARLLFDQPALA